VIESLQTFTSDVCEICISKDCISDIFSSPWVSSTFTEILEEKAYFNFEPDRRKFPTLYYFFSVYYFLISVDHSFKVIIFEKNF
jgi:hypothetical protein